MLQVLCNLRKWSDADRYFINFALFLLRNRADHNDIKGQYGVSKSAPCQIFMTSSSPKDTLIPSPLASTSLKLVGAITIAAALIDFLTLLFPPNFGNRAWQLATVTSLVDRGIVPLVGIALLFPGYLIDSSLGKTSRLASFATAAMFWTCFLSFILCLY